MGKHHASWKEQEAAFFDNDDNSSTVAVGRADSVDDGTIARHLQSIYLCEEVIPPDQQTTSFNQLGGMVDSDAELARKIMEEDRKNAASAVEADEKFALELSRHEQRRDSNLRKTGTVSRATDGDAALARRYQEEENRSSSSRTSSSRTGGTTTTANSSSRNSRQGNNSGSNICAMCLEPATYFIEISGTIYHPKCFKCVACFNVIRSNESFCTSTDEDGVTTPFHRQCYAKLFGKTCTICNEAIPTNDNGTISYHRHPFFSSDKMCPKHLYEDRRRCTGCYRYEPNGEGFADLGDADRCVCHACCRTIIVDNADAKPLWDKVLHFFEHVLQLPIWEGMREIPVLIVGHSALNDQLSGSSHVGTSQHLTRGLCLSEHQRGVEFQVPNLRYNWQNGSFMPSDDASVGHSVYQIPNNPTTVSNARVTAILCLLGLPADLTASILAHEATHAWIKLNPNFRKQIPKQVEEGCCQLVAMLFLNDGLEPANTDCDEKEGPDDLKLRQFFKYSIETDKDEIYGTGYKLAAQAYAEVGIEPLLNHIISTQQFPILS